MSESKNKVQPRQSLSSMKEGPAKGLKNILANPQELIWPIVKDDIKKKEIDQLLCKLLPQKSNNSPISWAKLRKLSKEDRAALKKDAKTKNPVEDDRLNSVIFGINAVTRALEKKAVASVILDSSINPLLLVKHIVIMGKNQHIPVILIPSLKVLTLNKLGFSGAALAFKMSVRESQETHFHKLHNKISELAAEIPTTKDPLEISKEPLDSPSIISDDDTSSTDEESTSPTEKTYQPFILPASIYKYRESRTVRVFIPPLSEKIVKEEPLKEPDDYISLHRNIDVGNANEDAAKCVKKRRYTDYVEDDNEDVKKLKKVDMDVDNKVKNENIKHDKIPTEVRSAISDNSTSKLGHTGKKNKRNASSIYLPLKVKQIKKNPNRLKATKIPKVKKKKIITNKNK